MARVYTSPSAIHGMGVFAWVPISPGEIVLRIDDSRVITKDRPLDSAKGELEHHCDYLAGGKVVLMQPPERFINHSCNARTLGKDRWVIARRDVHAGDQITYDYCLNSEGNTAWDLQIRYLAA